MNCELHNAIVEGGPRNGVLTGVEDYLTDSSLDWHFLHLPLYYGLGIMVTRQQLQANPALQMQLNRYTLSEGAAMVVSLVEHIRCTDGVMMQSINRLLLTAEARVEELEAQISGSHREHGEPE